MTGPRINLHLGVIRGVPSGALHICAVGTCTSSSVQSTALRRISA